MQSNYTIKLFDPKAASPEEYRAFSLLDNAIRSEKLPNDPAMPLEEHIQRLQNIPAFADLCAWNVWSADHSVIAAASVTIYKTEDNQHFGEANIQVLPDFRRQGIAKKLLGYIAAAAQENHRSLIFFNTNERVPAGEKFMERLGAEPALKHHANSLDLADLNRDLMRAWLEQAKERAADFELGLWEGAYPEQDIEAIAELYFVMNSAPRDQLDIQDFRFTAQQVRDMEHSILARGSQRWTMYVREKSSGKFAGITEVFWNPNRPHILIQGKTGVFPQYRNKGLGRWLKAAMLEKILRERPKVKTIRTGNAGSNAPMLKINYELGFKHSFWQCVWQIKLDKVFEYLKKT